MITKLPPITSPYEILARNVQPGAKGLPTLPQLDIGKILSASVHEGRGQNTFCLEIADLRIDVQSNLPLVKGEQIQVQVLSRDPVLTLQKVDLGLSPQIRQTLALAGELVNVKPLLQNLQSTFFPVAKHSPTTVSTVSQMNAIQVMETGPQTKHQTLYPVLQKIAPEALQQRIRQGNYTVKASLLANHGENRVLVRIAGESYSLQGQMTIEPGESKVLQLQSLQPEVAFFPLSDKGVVNSTQALVLAGGDQALSALVKALKLPLFTGLDLLQPKQQQVLKSFLSLQSLHPEKLREPGAGALLKNNLQLLGLRSEAMVVQGKGQDAANQLKSVLAEVVRLFQGQEEISAAAGRLLANLETNQFVQANLQNENALLFPLPFSFLEKGYLMVEKDGGQQEDEGDADERVSCTLHLTLEGLGNIRVRCIQTKDSVRIAFCLDSSEKADFVSSFEQELQTNISSVPQLSLSFVSGADSPAAALLQMLLPDERSLFSTSA